MAEEDVVVDDVFVVVSCVSRCDGEVVVSDNHRVDGDDYGSCGSDDSEYINIIME
ncbi:hypothetical protein HAX54_035362, partial [Datura stramonium]|nr:hypothetical protein [Datura stramonium]